MMKDASKKFRLFLFSLAVFITAFFVSGQAWAGETPPPAINYAPNFWFSQDENYYPVNPLEFYFENGLEIKGEIAVQKYNGLSSAEKREKMTVFYHIQEQENVWVYQYWSFYVFNDYQKGVRNEHYGDWETVFIFVDKKTKKVLKAVGSAHQRKLFDTEINNPKTNHVWTYVGEGSHANCVDMVSDGYCDFRKWRSIERWNKGGKSEYMHYTLLHIASLLALQFKGTQRLTESERLGVDLGALLSGGKYEGKIYLPFGGSPPLHAWEQRAFYNPNEVIPISISYLWKKITDKLKQAKNALVNAFESLFKWLTEILKGLFGQEVQQNALANLNIWHLIEGGLAAAPPVTPLVENMSTDTAFPPSGNDDRQPERSSQEQNEGKTIQEPSFEEDNFNQEDAEKEKKEPLPGSGPQIGPLPPGAGYGSSPNETGSSNSPPDSSEGETTSSSSPALSPPSIISPKNNQIFGPDDDLSTSTDAFQIELIGTSTPNFSILLFINASSTLASSSTTADVQGNWRKVISLKEGLNNIGAKNQDTEGNESEEINLKLIVDTVPPTYIDDLSAQSDQEQDRIILSWSAPCSSSSPVLQYTIKRASSTITDENWSLATSIPNSLLPAACEQKENFAVNDLEPGRIYYFAVQSKDQANNASEISNSANVLPDAPAHSVVINEVSINDEEFVELYNPSNQDVDLTGWHLAYYPANHDWPSPSCSYCNQEFPQDAIIPAQGHYLVTLSGWPDRNSSFVSPDWQTYMQLSDVKGSLVVFSEDPTSTTSLKAIQHYKVDAVGWGEVSYVYEQMPADAAPKGKSLIRQTEGKDTNDNSSDFIINDWPNPRNSSNETITIVSDNTEISQETTWLKSASPYVLTSNKNQYPTIKTGATLFIEPGVTLVVDKYYVGLLIKGILKAQGTTQEPIIFRGFGEAAESGDWSGLVFDGSAGSVMKYVNFEYGGHAGTYQIQNDFREMARIIDSQVSITNSLFKQSQGNGIYSKNSWVSVTDSIFSRNAETGLVINGGNESSVTNCQFEENNIGLEIINQAQAEVQLNSINGSKETAIQIHSAYPLFGNNSAADNVINGITVHWESVFTQDTIWSGNLPFVLLSNSNSWPTITASTTLTIKSGATIKPASKFYPALLVEGELISQGSASAPITFTSFYDDSYGGDTNNDGPSIGADGDWKNIRFAAGSKGILDWTRFYYSQTPSLDIDKDAEVEISTNCIWNH